MGANAQTTVPTFTAAQVLTADQQNQSARTGVPVFATTITRDAAFGGAGEKTLAEGQLAYVEGTGLQSYNGSSWVTWGTAPTSGLAYITGTTFSGAVSFSLPNDTFTSTYQSYRVWVQITSAVTNNSTLSMRLRAAGSDNTTSNYNSAISGSSAGGAAQNSGVGAGSSFTIGFTRQGFTSDVCTFIFDVVSPKETQATTYQGTIAGQIAASLLGFGTIGGQFQATTSFDALSIISSSGNIAGSYKVYGYANS
jgi:hypothetical protein